MLCESLAQLGAKPPKRRVCVLAGWCEELRKHAGQLMNHESPPGPRGKLGGPPRTVPESLSGSFSSFLACLDAAGGQPGERRVRGETGRCTEELKLVRRGPRAKGRRQGGAREVARQCVGPWPPCCG